MKAEFSERPIEFLLLPIASSAIILHPERVVISFGDSRSIDIGAICYPLRAPTSTKRLPGKGRLVRLESFLPHRTHLVRRLMDFFSTRVKEDGRRMDTHFSDVNAFVKTFLDWADTHDELNALQDVHHARRSFTRFIENLWHRVRTNRVKSNSAAQLQNNVLRCLNDFFEIDDIHKGVQLIKVRGSERTSTSPPAADAQAKVLSLTHAFFTGICDLTINNETYPFRMEMPKYLKWQESFLWIFPTTKWFMAPETGATGSSPKTGPWAYDYRSGRIANLEEIKRYNQNAKSLIRDAQAALSRANSDARNLHRLGAGMFAQKCFVVQFVANTSINLAQLRNLVWSEAYSIGTERQGFREIKYRAGNRIVQFEISIEFLPTFRRYLSLRKYLLNNSSCDLLFFSYGLKKYDSPKKIPVDWINRLYATLRAIDPTISAISPRSWRAGTSDWLLANTDAPTAALILQNSEDVVRRSYSAGTESAHFREMSDYLSEVSKSVAERGQQIPNSVECGVGVCSEFGAPKKIAFEKALSPDCKKTEGCLFCDKFRIHADEKDLRKILSCRFVLRKTVHLATNRGEYDRYFAPIFQRIDSLLLELSSRDLTLVQAMENSVDVDGELDRYWSAKLELLMDLEVVFE